MKIYSVNKKKIHHPAVLPPSPAARRRTAASCCGRRCPLSSSRIRERGREGEAHLRPLPAPKLLPPPDLRDGAAAPTCRRRRPNCYSLEPPPLLPPTPSPRWSRRLLLFLDGAAADADAAPHRRDPLPHRSSSKLPPPPAPSHRSRSPHHSISSEPPPTRSLVRPTAPP